MTMPAAETEAALTPPLLSDDADDSGAAFTAPMATASGPAVSAATAAVRNSVVRFICVLPQRFPGRSRAWGHHPDPPVTGQSFATSVTRISSASVFSYTERAVRGLAYGPGHEVRDLLRAPVAKAVDGRLRAPA